MRRTCSGSRSTGMDTRIGLIVGLAIVGSQAAAAAQGLPGAGAATAPASPAVGAANSAPSNPARTIARPRRPTSSSFQRVVTTRRATVYPTSRNERPVARDPMSENDPFRPYSERARQARLQAAAGTTRPQPAATQPPQIVQSSRSYYPGMRMSQHPNANTAQVRRPYAGGMGMIGTHRCTTGRAGAIAGGAAHGR